MAKMERVVQINEQCCIWKNNGKLRNRINIKIYNGHPNQAICCTK